MRYETRVAARQNKNDGPLGAIYPGVPLHYLGDNVVLGLPRGYASVRTAVLYV